MHKNTTCYKDPTTKTSWRRIGDLVQIYWPHDTEMQVRHHDDCFEARTMVRGGINDWMPWKVVVDDPTEAAGVRAYAALLGSRKQKSAEFKTSTKWYDAKWTPWDRDTMASDHTPPKLVRKNKWGNFVYQPGAPNKLYWRSLRSEDVENVSKIWEKTMNTTSIQTSSVSPFIADSWTDSEGREWFRGPNVADSEVHLKSPTCVFCCLKSGAISCLQQDGETWLEADDYWSELAFAAMVALYPYYAACKLCHSISVHDQDEIDQARNEFLTRTTGVLSYEEAEKIFAAAHHWVTYGHAYDQIVVGNSSETIVDHTDEPRTAASFLEAGLGHMKDRAATYDKPQGERSMDNCVAAFNTITGHTLTEEQGWLFMALLKIVRTQQGAFRADNYEDLAAYAGLAGESAARTRSER